MFHKNVSLILITLEKNWGTFGVLGIFCFLISIQVNTGVRENSLNFTFICALFLNIMFLNAHFSDSLLCLNIKRHRKHDLKFGIQALAYRPKASCLTVVCVSFWICNVISLTWCTYCLDQKESCRKYSI